MTLKQPSEVREVYGLEIRSRELIDAYIQGAVYCWIKNRPDEWFAVRDLVGGENTDWRDTPLQSIFERHTANGSSDEEAFDLAAKDIGWIVKAVLTNDRREFELDNSGYVNNYRWVRSDPIID